MALFIYGFKSKYEGFRESFCESLHVQLAAKLFCLETFMVYLVLSTINDSHVSTIIVSNDSLVNACQLVDVGERHKQVDTEQSVVLGYDDQ